MLDLSRLDVCVVAGTLGPGGAERQLFNLVRALRDSGARARVLCLNRGEFWEDPIARLGVPITWTGRRRSRIARLAAIVSTLRRDPPTVIQSQHFYTNLYVAAAARILGVPDVGALYNDARSEIRAVGRVFGRPSLRAPRLIASNSRAAMAGAVQLGVRADRLHFLPNIVDVDAFVPGDRGAGDRSPNRPVTILSVGRLVPQKRMDRLLTVVARAARQVATPIRTIIVGSGSDEAKQQLMRHAAASGLSPDAVEFRRPVHDLATLYQQADIFMLASDWEGTSNAIMEAMASALPVVVTSVGGVTEMIEHRQTGFLLDPRDEDGLVDGLLELVRSPERRRRIGFAARAAMVAHHAPQRLPAYLADLYGALSGGSPPLVAADAKQTL